MPYVWSSFAKSVSGSACAGAASATAAATTAISGRNFCADRAVLSQRIAQFVCTPRLPPPRSISATSSTVAVATRAICMDALLSYAATDCRLLSSTSVVGRLGGRRLHRGQDNRVDDLSHEFGVYGLPSDNLQQAHRQHRVGDHRPVAIGGYFTAGRRLRQNHGE